MSEFQLNDQQKDNLPTCQQVKELAKHAVGSFLNIPTPNKFKFALPTLRTFPTMDWDKIYNSFNEMYPKIETYLDFHDGTSAITKVQKVNKVIDDQMITKNIESKHSLPQKSMRQLKKERKAQRESTAGEKWFNFKAPELTDEIKQNLEVLRMRNVHDPKRFYKHNDRKTIPKYFQVGKIMDNAADFYSSRLTLKDRKKTLADELLGDAKFKQYQKRKYKEIIMKRMNRSYRRKSSKKQNKFNNKQKMKMTKKQKSAAL